MNQEKNNLHPNNFNQQLINSQTQSSPGFQQNVNTFENNTSSRNLNNKQPKKMNLIIGTVVFIIIIGLIVGLVIITNKKPIEETPQVEKNPITKDEFEKIENQYLQSSNVFNIESISPFSRVIVSGKVSKGVFSENDIGEFVDQYGVLRKTAINYISTLLTNTETIVEGNSGDMLIELINKEDLNYSTIIFKNQNYNGIEISFDYNKSELDKIENYFKSKERINVTINDNVESSEIIAYYTDHVIKTVSLYLILNSDNTYSIDDNVKINDLNIFGEIKNLLK